MPGDAGYSSDDFANPIRKVLASLLMTRTELRHNELPDRPGLAAHASAARSARLGYTVDVVEHYLYSPLLPSIRAVALTARRLPSRRLDAYLAYMLIATLAVVVAVVTALAKPETHRGHPCAGDHNAVTNGVAHARTSHQRARPGSSVTSCADALARWWPLRA